MKSKPPKRKSTAAEVESRVQAVADALSSGATTADVKKLCRERWDVDWRQAVRYETRAREILRKAVDKSKAELRTESYRFYQSVLASEESSWADKIRAQSRVDELMGLPAPKETVSQITVTEPVEVHQPLELDPEHLDKCLLMGAERRLAAKGEEALQAFIANVRKSMEIKAEFKASIERQNKPKAVVEIASSPATEPEPEAASSGWTPPVREPGKHFDESTIAPPAAKKKSNGRYGLAGLF